MSDANAQETGPRQAALEDLYVRHGALVYRTCRRILVDHHAAEDATQEVFAKLFSHGDLTSVRDQRRWLLEVTRNHCIDRMRADARRPTTPIAAGRPDAAEDAEARSLAREHLRWLLTLLTPRQRDVLMHRAVLDEPLDTVASRLGLSYGAAAQALYRARAVLARAGAAGDAAAILAGGRIAAIGRRLQALVLRFSAGRLQGGRVPLDAALALPVAALLVALLSGGQATAHRPVAPPASPAILAGEMPSAVRIGAPARPPAVAIVAVRGGATAPVAAPPAPHPAHVPAPPGVKKGPISANPCITVGSVSDCLLGPQMTVTMGLNPGFPLP